MHHDPLRYPWPSRRFVKYTAKGMVATSQPLAALAGRDILQRGGNAVDAAIATAICLTVVEPTSNGIGGDAFALVWIDGKLHGLNASGRTPAAMTRARLAAAGHDTIPQRGWETVSVPGTPSAWAALSQRFGRLPFDELFEPAITAARSGYAVSPILGKVWKATAQEFGQTLQGAEYEPWFDTFTDDGRAPDIGAMVRLPDHAATLEEIASTKSVSFYEGRLAEQIDRYARRFGAALRADDLSRHRVEWIDPISVHYRGYDVWEMPPNGQGIVALQALNIFDRLHHKGMPEDLRQHYMIEAVKAAFADAHAHVGDPQHVQVPTDQLLSDEYALRRSGDIGLSATHPAPIELRAGGTVYLAAADSEGCMVSLIQSNYKGFGSGLVVPGTGIALHNRAKDFSLDPTHPNALEPGKRPFHTIIPGFLTRDGKAVGPFGVMGGYMQPQGHVQLLSNMIDLGMNPQAALDAPRWCWEAGRRIATEPEFPADLLQALMRRGHEVSPRPDETGFGRGQVILRDPATGVLAGGSDRRTDGEVAIL